MQQEEISYPVRFSVDYPDRDLNRLTTFFRLFTAIPIIIVLGSVSGGTWQWSYDRGTAVAAGAGGLLFFGPLLMVLFRQKYPGGGSTGTSSCSGSRTASVSTSASWTTATRQPTTTSRCTSTSTTRMLGGI